MKSVFAWIKNNKVLSIFLLLAGWYLYAQTKQSNIKPILYNSNFDNVSNGVGVSSIKRSFGSTKSVSNVKQERKTIGNYNLSVLVKETNKFVNKVSSETELLGGFVVSSNIYSPEDKLSNGHITVRIPLDSFEDLKGSIENSSVKIVSYNKANNDVTDRYYDNKTRLETLLQTKSIYENMLTKTTKVTEIMSITREILNIQTQIEGVLGRQKYLDKTTSTVLVSISFSTDELELPYSPTNKFRPQVVFKYAVRALLGTFIGIGNWLIWGFVYSVIWIPLLIIFFIGKKLLKSRKS